MKYLMTHLWAIVLTFTPIGSGLAAGGQKTLSDSVVTLSETSQSWAADQQTKSLEFHGSAFAVVGNFRSI